MKLTLSTIGKYISAKLSHTKKNNILDINPKNNYKNNFILLDENNYKDDNGSVIKSSKLIITLNEKLYKKYNDMNINTKFIEIYRNYNQTKYDLLNNKVEDINFVFIIPSYNNSPYYKKNLDSVFSDLLVKIFCNIVDVGLLNTAWAISETKKLQNLEGTIDMLTFRLAKTRFWNYISNKT